ncbi:MAG TPA: glycoside hydrolase family 99-like domain-containing protein [Bryobacteraceae bacterium]|nr:glycoside hydrolase family 99-like domain-containing protein [Bryobacteraceae bacterium]
MNILFVSHCDFTGNSAMHIFSIAEALRHHGVDSVACVPNDPSTVYAHGEPPFQVLHHEEAARWGAIFPDGRGPDIVHAWTPREFIRVLTEKLIERYHCPYIVHLEDNEQAIFADKLGLDIDATLSRFSPAVVGQLVPAYLSHPQRSKEFIAGAAGLTVLMDRLLEFKPERLPGLVFWPGFDPIFLTPPCSTSKMRSKLAITEDEIVVVYNGNIHHSNEWEVTSLILAIRILCRRGAKVKLLKTGWNDTAQDVVKEAQKEGYLIDLGFVDRDIVPLLVSAADILVQPGRPNEFNDYRFPSKLPEFLISGKPVILPRSNIGRFLQDRVNCLLLSNGDAFEIADRLEELITDRELQQRVGSGGREFAMGHLQWHKNVEPLFDFYSNILASPARTVASIPGTASELNDPPAKLIAFYSPRFFPTKESDEWWGEGFTEWSNVASAKPAFPGHHQPQLPANFGFYDLRVPDVMQKQAEIAAEHGIYGFCLYYYWFNGKKLLDLPLNQMLSSGKPDFPFCLCWANENWTRDSDSGENEILLEQVYSVDDDERFIRELIPVFRDPRYIRIGNAPLLLVYCVTKLPNAAATAELWRKICADEGIPEIHLAAVQSFGFQDPAPFGFDSAVESPTHIPHDFLPHEIIPDLSPDFDGYFEDYVQVARQQIQLPKTDYIRYRSIIPAWDNTAYRRNHAHIVIRSTPELYEKWLRTAVDLTLLEPKHAPLVFINGWNEWAEGAHLEPDQKYGMAHLEATRRGLCSGAVNFFNRLQLPVSEAAIENIVESAYIDRFGPIDSDPTATAKMKKTENWFEDSRLEEIAKRYAGLFPAPQLSYATVSDYCDSFDHLNPLATTNGDLKDVQRPWVLKTILGRVPKGGRLLEIGAGEPFVADLLTRLGYEVWVVDPYDGSGNGPLEYERFLAECPDVRFIRSRFGDQLLQLPEQSLDCVYSISVLEHIPPVGLQSVAAGMKKFLKKNGLSIHAVDHVHRGNGAPEHLTNLELMMDLFGLSRADLSQQLERVNQDVDTYFLSAESHNRWRGSTPYRDFPMRVCISVQLCSDAAAIQVPQSNAGIGDKDRAPLCPKAVVR